MSYYNTHMFFCTNKRENKAKASCGDHNSSEMVAYAKEKAALLGLNKECKFRISSSGCMGRCEEGPVLVVYPQGEWFNYSSKEDIDNILRSIAAKQSLDGNI
jgi:(2Fe-2S) ferredoxin